MNIVGPSGALRPLVAGHAPVVAVLQVEDEAHAAPLLDALVEGGITLIEVTLRSAGALAVIEAMSRRATPAIVGAGTLTRPEQFDRARDAGARFAVSPAFSPALAQAASAAGLPFLPGAASPSEVLVAREHGFTDLKFFPAELNGGVRWLQHMAPLFPDVSFCPTGGITASNLHDFLALPNCFVVGGAFVATRQAIGAADWSGIEATARQAVAAARR